MVSPAHSGTLPRAGIALFEILTLEGAEAEQFARQDPYTVHGVFERVEIHRFMQVLPK